MDKWVDHVNQQDKEGSENIKTEEEWEKYKTNEEWHHWFRKGKVHIKFWATHRQKMKEDYLKYGSIYGKKYAVTTDYGSWDSEFTKEKLDLFIKHFYRILKPGGTCIIFFDLWKISYLKEMMEKTSKKKRKVPTAPRKNESQEEFEKRKKYAIANPKILYGFNQLRFIEWIKTNPQPLNSSRNYLTNCREIALLGVKKGSPTFNSSYDNAIYKYPIQGGKDRFHPTQKSLPLFEELIKKHSNEGDVVLDCFLGSGTTAVAALNTNREFVGCEVDEEYYIKSLDRLGTFIAI